MRDLIAQLGNSLHLLKNHRRKLAIFIALGQAIKILTALVVPRVTQILFDAIQAQNASGSLASIFIALIFIAILMLFIALMNIYGDSIATELSFSMVRNCFEDIYAKPVTDIINKFTAGEIYQRVLSGSHGSLAIWFGMVDLTSSIISLLLVFLIVGDVSAYILAAYIMIPIITVAHSAVSFTLKKKASRAFQENEAAKSNTLLELISGADTLKNFGAAQWMEKRYHGSRAAFYAAKRQSVALDAIMETAQDFVDFIFTSVFAFLIRIPSLTWGAVGATFLLYDNVKRKSSELYSSVVSLPSASIPLKRLAEALGHESAFEAQYSGNGIALKDITLTHGGAIALNKISIDIKLGDKVAFIGRNGSGKTSMLKIIIGHIQPTAGAVTMPFAKSSERKANISLALADPQLYKTSVADNVAMCRDDARDVDIDNSLRQTLISNHKGKQVVELSQGERQRVGLARALAKNAPLLVFDEPTSSLDPNTSLTIMKSVMHSDQTVLFATHDLEIAKLADYVIMLESGTVKHIFHKDEYSELAIAHSNSQHA
jgi:ABC-type bacteriocin/lantibiotic exporter with double-glycine peptidase domain